jgi:hypothetical protein
VFLFMGLFYWLGRYLARKEMIEALKENKKI